MAYTDNDHRLTVYGTYDNGEVWTNRWGWQGDETVDPEAVCAAFHDFYEAIFGLTSSFSSHTHATGATETNLLDNVSFECDWSTIDGDDLVDLLPTSSALRVSLQTGSVHGGPFLTGFGVNAVNADGNAVTGLTGGIVDAVVDLQTALSAMDAGLAIDRPSVPAMIAADRVKVGQRFDVIRKRTNDLAESYAVATLPT